MRTANATQRPALKELQRAETVLHACGLRFDGYRYAESMTAPEVDHGAWLVQQRETFAQTLMVPPLLEDAFAAFFAFQRGAKNDGWFLDRCVESLAGPFLFLHLYREPTPERWCFENFSADWDRIPTEEREAAAATVRRWLV